METVLCSGNVVPARNLCSAVEAIILETAVAAAGSLLCSLLMLGSVNGPHLLPTLAGAVEGSPLTQLVAAGKKPSPENKDAGDGDATSEDDEDENENEEDGSGDDNDDQEDGSSDDGGESDDPKDPLVNGEGGSDEEDDDEDDDDEDDDDEDDDDEEDVDEEDDEDEIPQPPTKKRK
ncbi:Replicase polyprotein 1a [Linum grandiflorum]